MEFTFNLNNAVLGGQGRCMVVHAFAMECIAITGFREFGISEILRAGFVLTFCREKGASIFWHFVMQAKFMSYLASVFFL